MAGKDSDYRVFVGGLSWEVTERQLENAFSRFGKIIDAQVIQERDTGRPRGFGFLTFSDRRDMEDAIREMDGSELGERVISVNKAKPKMGGDDPDHHSYGGTYPPRSRGGSYGGGADRSLGQDECFKCGRSGHWARDCPSPGGGRGGGSRFSSRSRFGGAGGRGSHYADRDRFVDDRYDGGSFVERDRYDSRASKYGSRGRYATNDRYPPSGDRFGGDRYGAPDRYPQNGYARDRDYDSRDVGPRRSNDRYGGGGGGGPARYEGRSYRDRPAPYDRPRRAAFDY